MPRLEDFREMIDGVDDLKVLESGQSLLREMIQINEMKIKNYPSICLNYIQSKRK